MTPPREFLAQGEKPLIWMGSSQKDLESLPKTIQTRFGCALGLAQFGGKHAHAKPWKGDGPGLFEVVEDFRGDTFRAMYTVRFEKAVYVLHVFQKKSKHGIKTDRGDQELVASRLRDAERDYGKSFGRDSSGK